MSDKKKNEAKEKEESKAKENTEKEEVEQEEQQYGGLPNRNLKKNLGCGG
ncbi:hypothetical protein GCM10009122_15810 [Fulvivirga kasyanovii]|nr:hypothetical protein [Fulvivirga kasyanovii]